jgi:hypothetical protein
MLMFLSLLLASTATTASFSSLAFGQAEKDEIGSGEEKLGKRPGGETWLPGKGDRRDRLF